MTLASAFALKGPNDWWREARTYLGSNGPLLVSAAKQTADAWVGAALLTAGFSGQLAASAGADPPWAYLSWTLPAVIYLDVVCFLALWLITRPFNVRRVVGHALEHLWPEYEHGYSNREEAVKAWWQSLEGMARVAGFERPASESLPDFARRFLGERRLRRIDVPPP